MQALSIPPKRFFIRVNLLRTTPEKVQALLSKIGLKSDLYPVIPEALHLPIEGPFEIEGQGKKIRTDKFAAEAVHTGADLYAPGVLQTEKIQRGDPVSIIDPLGNQVGYGISHIDSRDRLRIKQGLAVKVLESKYKIPKLKISSFFEEGLWYHQSLPAMVASRVLDPQPEELIVDLCAAPGGKTTHIAELMKNNGRILAFDRSPNRTLKLRENINRLGIKIVEIFQTRKLKQMIECLKLENKVDRVIVDPPCSALGIRPKLYDDTTTKDILNHANHQKFFLHLAVKLVKSGGTIVYSTCTLEPEENEMNMEYCKNKLGCTIEHTPLALGGEGELGDEKEKFIRFYPDLHDTSGYFIARLTKSK